MFRKLKKFSDKSVVVLIIPVLFLVIGVITLPDYGVNWDSFVHFSRGQSYLNFFLTGKKNFDNLPPLVYSKCNSGNLSLILPACPGNGIRRSFYQNDYYNFEFYIKNDSGHPPLNDILAALTNYIFYQKLGLINDTLSYHLFIVFSSFLLVLSVAVFVKKELGWFAAIVSSIVLAGYPIFFSESHFNIKDPTEAAFFGLTLIFFYLGIVKNNWKLIIVSAIFAGFALGTKLNIVFAVFIVVPWLFYFWIDKFPRRFTFRNLKIIVGKNKAILASLVLYLPISCGIVYALWPYLWQDPRNVFNILGYYSQIGAGTPADLSKYIFFGWNLYPIYWIIITTPVPALVLTALGIVFIFLSKKYKKFGFSFFTLLWFLVPIIRVSWPNADIYGGVRQIMEYVPAMAILAGMGAYLLLDFAKKVKPKSFLLVYIVVSLGLVFSIFEIVKIHPNENIYFNQLVGGLKGASRRNIPYWGNTYGSVYLEGVRWLNNNAGVGAKVALPLGVMSNISRTMFRPDIDYSKPNWTGPNRGGEYGIEMYFEWPQKYWYSFQYYDKYLDPVYVYSVDGVPILKVWKNDLEHTKPEFRDETIYLPEKVSIKKNTLGSDLKIDMGKDIFLTKLVVRHSNFNCQNGLLGYVALSSDGKSWQRESEPITLPQVAPGVSGNVIGWSDTNFVYLFAGTKARYIMLDPQTVNSCYLRNFEVQISGLENLP